MKQLIVIISIIINIAVPAYAFPPAPIPQTGQTSCRDASRAVIGCLGTGQDGENQSGVPLPTPRFIDNSNGTITDKLTGLIWLKNANCFGAQSWAIAVSSARTLASGACGLTDGSSAGQWRLPSLPELESIVKIQESPASWLGAQGFTSVMTLDYWSSSNNGNAWSIDLSYGYVHVGAKSSGYIVWPVRGGI